MPWGVQDSRPIAACHDRAEENISVGGVVELCRLVLIHMKSAQE